VSNGGVGGRGFVVRVGLLEILLEKTIISIDSILYRKSSIFNIRKCAMIRFCNRNLFFMLVAICMASNNALFPMLRITSKIFKKEHKDLCERPPTRTETTIEDIPDDCLHIILQLVGKKSFGLRRVSKQFRNLIKGRSCLFHNIDRKPYFLRLPLKETEYSIVETEYGRKESDKGFAVKLCNKEIVDAFVDDVPEYKFVNDDAFYTSMKLPESDYAKFLPVVLKKLLPELNQKNSRLKRLKVDYDGWRLKRLNPYVEMHNFDKSGQPNGIGVYHKKKIEDEEWEMFGSPQHVKLSGIKKFTGSEIPVQDSKVPFCNKITSLMLQAVPKFKYGNLEKMPNLKELYLFSQHGLKVSDLGDAAQKIKKLVIVNCKKFTGKGLSKMTNLEDFAIEDNDKKFDIKSLKELKKLKRLGLKLKGRKIYPDGDFRRGYSSIDPTGTLDELKKNGCSIRFIYKVWPMKHEFYF